MYKLNIINQLEIILTVPDRKKSHFLACDI